MSVSIEKIKKRIILRYREKCVSLWRKTKEYRTL